MDKNAARIRQAALRLFADRETPDIGVAELARASGVARGTVYSHVASPGSLFSQLATELAVELTAEVQALSRQLADPAERVALGIRFFVQRAHDDNAVGRFLGRHGASTPSLRVIWAGPPLADVLDGVASGRFAVSPAAAPQAVASMAATVLAAMLLVTEGHAGWRPAAHDAVEFVLRGLGLTPAEAARVADCAASHDATSAAGTGGR